MKRTYVPIDAIKVAFDKSASVISTASSCWEVITNKLGGGVCTTEEPGHVNEWVDDNDPSYQYC